LTGLDKPPTTAELREKVATTSWWLWSGFAMVHVRMCTCRPTYYILDYLTLYVCIPSGNTVLHVRLNTAGLSSTSPWF
jgi:hypothetical protein